MLDLLKVIFDLVSNTLACPWLLGNVYSFEWVAHNIWHARDIFIILCSSFSHIDYVVSNAMLTNFMYCRCTNWFFPCRSLLCLMSAWHYWFLQLFMLFLLVVLILSNAMDDFPCSAFLKMLIWLWATGSRYLVICHSTKGSYPTKTKIDNFNCRQKNLSRITCMRFLNAPLRCLQILIWILLLR